MPVLAKRLIRKMRGGAQAHLLECDDGHFYVVKFRNNPQHRRVLVNEWIASAFLNYLQISTPETAIVNVPAEFSGRETPKFISNSAPAASRSSPAGTSDPAIRAIPPKSWFTISSRMCCWTKSSTGDEFLGALVFDKWIGNADARQAIFFRARLEQRPAAASGIRERQGFVAHMMDHGYIFDGPHWLFTDSPLQGLYFRPSVYLQVRSFRDFEPWLDQVVHFPEEIVDQALKQIPPGMVGRRRRRSRKHAHKTNDAPQTRPRPDPRQSKRPNQPVSRLAPVAHALLRAVSALLPRPH